jgi:nucleoid DNA-binding protein
MYDGNDHRPRVSRRGRNSQTGEQITINKRKVVTFKYSSKLKDELQKIKRNSYGWKNL